MLQPVQEKLFLYLRQIGFFLSEKIHSNLPKSILRRLFRHAKITARVSDFDGNLTMSLLLSEHMQRRIFWMGYYSQDIAHLLNHLLKPGMVVLDVGANIGEITMLAAQRVRPEGRVFSFEPMDEISKQLEWHIKTNQLHQVSIQKIALGETIADNIPIYLSCGQVIEDENGGLGSLYGGNQGQNPVQHITVTTLDDWQSKQHLERIDLIKIDIEGAELACLKGAKKSIQQYRPKIIIEIQDFSSARAGYKSSDILEFLSALNYEFHHIGKGGALTPLTTSSLQDFQNVLCTPQNTTSVHS